MLPPWISTVIDQGEPARPSPWRSPDDFGTTEDLSAPWIAEVWLPTTHLTYGVNVPYEVVLVNDTGVRWAGVYLQAWIEQGTGSRAACGFRVRCGGRSLGTFDPGTCDQGFVVGAGPTAAGWGTLHTGPAELVVELHAGSRVVDTTVLPISVEVP